MTTSDIVVSLTSHVQNIFDIRRRLQRASAAASSSSIPKPSKIKTNCLLLLLRDDTLQEQQLLRLQERQFKLHLTVCFEPALHLVKLTSRPQALANFSKIFLEDLDLSSSFDDDECLSMNGLLSISPFCQNPLSESIMSSLSVDRADPSSSKRRSLLHFHSGHLVTRSFPEDKNFSRNLRVVSSSVSPNSSEVNGRPPS